MLNPYFTKHLSVNCSVVMSYVRLVLRDIEAKNYLIC